MTSAEYCTTMKKHFRNIKKNFLGKKLGKHEICRKKKNTGNYCLVVLTSLKCKESVKYNWNCKQIKRYLLCYKIYFILELENKHSVGFASHHLGIEKESKKCWQEIITTFGFIN